MVRSCGPTASGIQSGSHDSTGCACSFRLFIVHAVWSAKCQCKPPRERGLFMNKTTQAWTRLLVKTCPHPS